MHFQAAAVVAIAGQDAAAMYDGDSLRDRQAQSSPAGLMLTTFRNAVERLKNGTAEIQKPGAPVAAGRISGALTPKRRWAK